jgi:hypothetical protein
VLREAEAEIKAGPHVGRRKRAAVPPGLPLRILGEVFEFILHPDVVQPDFTSGIGVFHHIQQTEAIHDRPVRFVSGLQVADGRRLADGRDDLAPSAIATRVVAERPVVDSPRARELYRVRRAGSAVRFKTATARPPA